MSINIIPYISEQDPNGKRLYQTNATDVSDPDNALTMDNGYVVVVNKAALNFTTPRAEVSFTLTRSGYTSRTAKYVKGGPAAMTLNTSGYGPITTSSPVGTVIGLLSTTGVAAEIA